MFPANVREAGVDCMTCGTYKWLLGGFGVAPFFVRRELLERIRVDRLGALHVEKELGDHRYEIYRTREEIRIRHAAVCGGLSAGCRAGLPGAGRRRADRASHRGACPASFARDSPPSGFRVVHAAGQRSSIVSLHLEPERGPRARGAGQRRYAGQLPGEGLAASRVTGALQHGRRHPTLSRLREELRIATSLRWSDCSGGSAGTLMVFTATSRPITFLNRQLRADEQLAFDFDGQRISTQPHQPHAFPRIQFVLCNVSGIMAELERRPGAWKWLTRSSSSERMVD